MKMFNCLKNSILYENDIVDENQLKKIVEYSNKLTNVPDLRKVFQLFSKNEVIKREGDIFVSSNMNFSKNFNANLVGMNHKMIDLNKIQEMINKYYENLNIEDGFKYYIIFELIHPFNDYNGRIGRFMFLEHPLKLYLSNVLINNKHNKKLHNRLFSIYSSKIRLYYNNGVLFEYKTKKPYVYKNFEYYLNLELNNETKKIIYELLKNF